MMNKDLEKALQDLLAHETTYQATVSTLFPQGTLEETIQIFENIKERDFSTLDSKNISITTSQINAFNKACERLVQLSTEDNKKLFLQTQGSLLNTLKTTVFYSNNNIEQKVSTLSEEFDDFKKVYIENRNNIVKHIEDTNQKLKELSPLETLTTEATTILNLAKEALDKAQTTKTIEFSDTLSQEYSKLQNRYFWTGFAWQALALASFIGIFCVLHYHDFCPLVPSDTMKDIFHDGFVNSIYALSPIFSKIGLIAFFATISGVCLKIYFQYKRLSQEYRQKSLLAKNLLRGHDVLKPYIGDKIDTTFILPTIEKMLEDPISKVYSKQESHENTLGLAEKVLELTKKGKELGTSK